MAGLRLSVYGELGRVRGWGGGCGEDKGKRKGKSVGDGVWGEL